MFTPSNIKKLVNISTITLNYDNTTFEIPIYPNTNQPISNNIYKNLKHGLLQSKKNIEKIPGNSIEEKIKYILENGSKKITLKNKKNFEENKINKICLILILKLRFKKRRIDMEIAKDLVRKYSLNKEIKVIVHDIIKDLVRKDSDFEEEMYLVRIPILESISNSDNLIKNVENNSNSKNNLNSNQDMKNDSNKDMENNLNSNEENNLNSKDMKNDSNKDMENNLNSKDIENKKHANFLNSFLQSKEQKNNFYRISGDNLFFLRKYCLENKIKMEIGFESECEDEIIC